MLITALNPKIGYEKSAEIAKKAFKEKNYSQGSNNKTWTFK